MSKSVFTRGMILLLVAVLLVNPAVPARADSISGVREALLTCYNDHLESVDLSGYRIDAEELAEVYRQMMHNNELPWYADQYTYSYDKKTGEVIDFQPNDLDETVYDRNLYEQKVAQILAATVHPGMSHWQIALSIHDYLAANFCYDESYTYYEGYDLLVRGTAVCEGYTKAYMDLLKRAGVPCVKISSDSMNHSWNLVRIGEYWYHVDVTWDDPTTDAAGFVGHDYFLISDSMISDEAHEHHGWETDTVCSDTSMDTGCFWEDVESQICYLDGDTSLVRYVYQDDNQYAIFLRNENDGELTRIDTLEMDYIDIGEGRYWYFNNGLTLWNGRIYYSDMEYVYSTDTAGGDKRTEFYRNAEKHGTYIYGSFVSDGCIYMTLSNHDGDLEDVRYQMEDVSFHSHSYTPEVTQATCTSPGYTTYTCGCGISYTGGHTPVADHVFENGIGNLFGGQPRRCVVCGTVVGSDWVSGEETAFTPEETEPDRDPKGIVPTILVWIADAWEKNPLLTGAGAVIVFLLLRRLFS